MRKFNKALSVVLAVLMLCVMMPFGAMVSASSIIDTDFEDGNQYFSSGCTLQVEENGGSKVLHWDASGADWANIYQYVSVETNTEYQVSFKMKSNLASGLSVKFVKTDWMTVIASESVVPTTDWAEYSVTLKSGADSSVLFMFQTGVYGSANQQIYIDDVVVAKKDASVEPEQPEQPDTPDEPGNEPALGETGLVVNGNFETGNNSGWRLYQSTKVAAAAAKTGSYGLHIVGNGGWGGLGNQTISGLEVGKTYRISLYYKALTGGVNIKLCAGSTDQGTELAYIYGTKTEWTQFAVEFEATTTNVFFTLVGSGTGVAETMYMDDISLTEVVLGDNDDDPNLKMIDTLMDDIKTQGRTAMVGGTLMLDFSISGIEFELDCAGDVYATFNARKISNSADEGGVYFTVYVDGKAWARNYCRIASVGENKVLLASNLPAGKHSFAIYRQSEHSFGEVGICALSYEGEMLAKPADKDLYIEFIGDSISCGYGNLGNNAVGDGSALYSDGTQAYTFLTAQALNADWSNVAWSGLGCKYGYSDTTMQDVYPAQRYNYDKTTMYNFSNEPDIVILALGTNDNSIQSNAALKRAGLVEMLELVREKNPNAPIVWIHGMMTTGVSSMIEEIVAEFGGSEAGFYACKLTQNNAGGGAHPNLIGQQTFANELVAFLQDNGLTEVAPEIKDLLSGGETSRMEMTGDKLGLAYKFTINAKGIDVINGNEVVYTNATVDAFGDGNEYKLVGMGAVITNNPNYGLSDAKMTLDNVDEQNLLDVPVRYLYNLDSENNTAAFAVRITNIPEDCQDVVIYARPYYIFEDAEGEQIAVYDAVEADNYSSKIDINDGILDWN